MSKSIPKVEPSPSLLEDASTLLMFATGGSSTGNGSPQATTPTETVPDLANNQAQVEAVPVSASAKTSRENSAQSETRDIETLASPGPACVALLEEEKVEKKQQAAMVAAAALAAAAVVPLPLKRSCSEALGESRESSKLPKHDFKVSKPIILQQDLQTEKDSQALQPQELQTKEDSQTLQQKELHNKEDSQTLQEQELPDQKAQQGPLSPVGKSEVEAESHSPSIGTGTSVHEEAEPVKDANETEDETHEQAKHVSFVPLDGETQGETQGETRDETQGGTRDQTQDETRDKTHDETQDQTHDETTPKWPVDDSYIVDPDEGTITCVCGSDEDDGFTIQCDHCNRWQHGRCYGIRNADEAPEEHLCVVCHPRKVTKWKRRDKRSNKSRRRVSHDDASSRDETSNSVTQGSSSGGTSVGTSSVASGNASGTTVANGNGASPSREQPFMTQEEADRAVSHRTNLVSAQQAFPAIFLPIDKLQYKTSFVENFTKKIPFSKGSPPQSSVEVKIYHESKKFSGISKLGCFTQSSVRRGDTVVRFLGEIDLKSSYSQDPRNHYRIWGTTKPKVFPLDSHPELVVDARLSGNLTRYIRRSCQPNAELCAVELSGKTELVVKALENLHKGQELTLGWNWDQRHPIHKLIAGQGFDMVSEPDKYLLIHSVESVLAHCECGCQSSQCYLARVKKFGVSLYRTFKSRGSNRLNELIYGKKGMVSKQVPVLERLEREEREHLRDASVLVNQVDVSLEHEFGKQYQDIRPYKMRLGPVESEGLMRFEDPKDVVLPVPVDLEVEKQKQFKKLSLADYIKKKEAH